MELTDKNWLINYYNSMSEAQQKKYLKDVGWDKLLEKQAAKTENDNLILMTIY